MSCVGNLTSCYVVIIRKAKTANSCSMIASRNSGAKELVAWAKSVLFTRAVWFYLFPEFCIVSIVGI